MKFSVQKKLIFLGSFISLILISASFLLSFFIYKNHSEKNFIKSIDNSIAELTNSLGKNNKDDLIKYYKKFYEDYQLSMDLEFPEFKDNQEKYDYLSEKYPNIYPSKGFGLSQEKLMLQNIYIEISSLLDNAAISSGGNIAYAGFFVSDESGKDIKLVYMFDANFKFKEYKENSYFPGEVYTLKDDDLDMDPNIKTGGYILRGAKTRVLDIDLGEIDGNNAEITAFIEYDDTLIKDDIRFFAIVLALSLFGFFIILLVAYVLILRFVLVNNITKLTNKTNEFTTSIKSGKEISVINPNINTKDEIANLSNSFVKMEEEIINYTKELEQITRENERINAELDVASKIQLEALPLNFYSNRFITINAQIKSAKEVGGDFYDYFYINENNLAFIISDVSGKGIPAALFMMRSKELIKSRLLTNNDLCTICYEVNNLLIKNNKEGLFITAFIGILNLKTYELKFINAGHEKPYLISNGKVTKLDTLSNFIIGGVEDFKYEAETIKLNKNDKLFLHTDGLNEAINDKKEEFSYDRIIKSLNNNKDKDSFDILNNMNNDLLEFTNSVEAFDDVTMLILDLSNHNLNFKFEKPNYEIIDIINDKFNDYYKFIDDKIKSEINIIFDEIINNYITYEKDIDLIIEINIELNNDLLIIEFINNGNEFNPLLLKDNYIEEYSSDLKLGGFGTSIVKSLSNKIDYKRIDNKNHLIIEKSVK